MSSMPLSSAVKTYGIVYENWCVWLKTGHSCVKTRGDLTRAVGEIDWEVEYVLHHARLLIVHLFDEERVILDALGQRLGSD